MDEVTSRRLAVAAASYCANELGLKSYVFKNMVMYGIDQFAQTEVREALEGVLARGELDHVIAWAFGGGKFGNHMRV